MHGWHYYKSKALTWQATLQSIYKQVETSVQEKPDSFNAAVVRVPGEHALHSEVMRTKRPN